MTNDHSEGTTPDYTNKLTMKAPEVSLGIVKPHAYKDREEIKYMIRDSGLAVPFNKDPYRISRAQAQTHYAEHKERSFYPKLIDMITSGEVELMIVEGEDAINRLSILTGRTDPREADPGTIRNRFGDKTGMIMNNAFHRSDSAKSARREILLYWDRTELPGRILGILDTVEDF